MKPKIAFCIGAVLLFVSAIVTLITLKAQSAQNDSPKIIIQQLASENGIIPVEIQNPQANFKSENTVDGITFVVKNNTGKNITAVCLTYSIQIERNKIESRDTFFQNVLSFVHEDIRESGDTKPITPGQEIIITDNGKISYEKSSLVKGVEEKIDYVEFEDGSILGENLKGGHLIALIRDGASKYKDWLIRQYLKKGKSTNTIVSLLQSNEIPAELGFSSVQQNLGAQIYRRQMRRIYEKGNTRGLEDFIQKNLVTPKASR